MEQEKIPAEIAAMDRTGTLPLEFQEAIRGYQVSRVMLTAVELDVFSAVGQGAQIEEIAPKVGADARATAMLLDALVSLNLLEKTGERYNNTVVTGRFLVAGAPDDSRAALMHTVNLWDSWSTLTECVRTGTSVGYKEMAARGNEWTVPFIAAMHRNASGFAPTVVKAVGIEGARRMLDVGGGSGAYAIAFAREDSALNVEIFDLATVVPIAEGHIAEAGLSDRVTVRIGDLRTDDFGNGYDLILLSAICHMLGAEGNRDLFQRCFKALHSSGRLVIQDFILEPNRTGPKTATLFALNMLVGTRDGNTYTETEYRRWFESAGFEEVCSVAVPGPSGVMVGRKKS